MTARNPWMKFYPQDWRGDAKLRVCSIGARGLWVEMMCIMHEAQPYGHLLVNGHPVTDTQLAMTVGVLPDHLPEYLGELEAAGVFSRTQKGVIYSRRMTRDSKRASVAQKNGKRGGNPNLSEERIISASDTPLVIGLVKPQKPEARSQKEKKKKIAKKKGSRIEPDWQPDKRDCEYARERGYSPGQIRELADGFRDHWLASTGAKAVKLDWHAAWRTWVRNDEKFNGSPAKQRSGGGVKGAGGVVAAVRNVVDESEHCRLLRQEGI